MTASEARNKAKEVNTNNVDSQYASIKKDINALVEEGKYSMFFYMHLLPDVENKLAKEGYKITSFSNMRNEVTITIKW